MRISGVVIAAAMVAVSLVAGCTAAAHTSLGHEGAITDSNAVGIFAQTGFPDEFSGVAISNDQTTIIVYRRFGVALDSAVRNQFPNVPIRFVDARYSAAQLASVARRVTADTPYWRARGIAIGTVGPADDGSGVNVGTPDFSAAQAPLLARYGAVVHVYNQPVPEYAPHFADPPSPSR